MLALKEALADVIASSIAGSTTDVTKIVRTFAQNQWGKGEGSIFLSSQKLNSSGAAFVNSTMANALDIDDGHRLVKGHPGAVVFPAVLAVGEELDISGEEFLSSLLVAYEVGIRAGILAHKIRPEYHCTGSWGAVGAAAGVSRVLGLSKEQLNYALGIAEYHSTYSPMMRCIDHPSMLKDGIGWGCMSGVSAAYLAKEGFTGIASLFSYKEANELLTDLGHRYRIKELYYKPHACCRWAQPAVEALKELMDHHDISHQNVNKINIYTFKESASLSTRYPKNTEEAQYNLSFPVAAYLVFQQVGPEEVLNQLKHPEVLKAMDKVEVHIRHDLDRKFPKKALSMVEVKTNDGDSYQSSITQARGDYDLPLTKEEKQLKFQQLVVPHLGQTRCEELYYMIQEIEKLANINELTSCINKNI